MTRNIFGVLFFIVSGFFVYMVGFLAFFDVPDMGSTKFLIMAIICIPLMIFHLIGLALYRGTNWKISTGVTVVIGASFNILVVIVMFSIKLSPEISEVMDTSKLSMFSDYLSGFTTMVLFVGLGTALYLNGTSANKSKQLNDIQSID